MAVRRARGVFLRLVRRRPLAIAVGVALAAPAAWLEFSGGSGAWWLDGLGLVAWSDGRRPDLDRTDRAAAGLGRHDR